jgi:tRNA(Ile)-lysidine synthase
MSLIDRVRRTIGRHNLVRPETRVVAALSGGADSMALTILLRELDAAGELRLVGVVHFNHQLRASADDDESFCRRVAESLELPIVAEREDVGARARRERRSIEDAARTARHAFFEGARLQVGADVIALGHTLDDQAETYALRLLRGAGPRGLAAMHPRRGALIRPLLDCRRAELRQLLNDRQIPFVHDETNDDLRIPRNRVRAELFPFLEARFNPSVAGRLADQAEIAREEWLWMTSEADALGQRLCRREDGRWMVAAEGLRQAPRALARLLVHEVMTDASGGRTVAFAHVESVLDLLRHPASGIDLPGQRVELIEDHLVFCSRPADVTGRWADAQRLAGAPAVLPFHHVLPVPGEVAVPEIGRLVCVEEAASAIEGTALAATADVAIVRKKGVHMLAVRSRRAGDRFRPMGLAGTKKLQDFFVDRKISRCLRDTVPLVVDQSDRIVWVAGHAVDDEFRVIDPAQAVLILRLKVLGGSA